MYDSLNGAIEMEQKYAKGKFPVYYDEAGNVLDKLKQEIKIINSKPERMPAILIVDQNGIIEYAYYSDAKSDNPRTEELLEAIKKLK